MFITLPARAEPPRPLDVAALAAAEALIVVDTLQTVDMNRHPASFNMREMNPLLGAHPSTERILATGAASAIATAVIWYVLPHPLRRIFTFGVVGVEIPCVLFNAQAGLSIRF